MNKEIIDDELTYEIIGYAMKVHNTLGNGFQEVIYQRALEILFYKSNLSVSREPEMPIYFEGTEIGTRRVDFLVNNQLMIELVSSLNDTHLAQGLNYLVAYNLNKGLLINFGNTRLEVKRLKHPRNKRLTIN